MARLKVKESTLKLLFTLSRNKCAFPDCEQRIYDEQGTLFGDVCHISAANPGGERYLPEMSDEDRRNFLNLIILCKKHHTVTNDVIAYPISKMKEIKAAHENSANDPEKEISEEIFTRIIGSMKNSGQMNIVNGNNVNVINNQTNFIFNQNTEVEDKEKLDIISELFDHIIESDTTGSAEKHLQSSERFINTTQKIAINFPKEQTAAVKRILVNTVHYKLLVETFLQSKSLINEGKVLAFKEKVQSSYCRKIKGYDTDFEIGDVEVLYDIRSELIPRGKKNIAEYQSAALAMILFFFEICDIGKKTVMEFEKSQEHKTVE